MKNSILSVKMQIMSLILETIGKEVREVKGKKYSDIQD